MAIDQVCYDEKTKLIKELLQTGCLKFGKFQLKSGIETDHYVNLREIGEYPKLFQTIVQKIANLLPSNDDIKIVGVPYGAVAIAGAVAYLSDRPYHFVRKEVKTYGYTAEEKTTTDHSNYVMIEDVMTTGSSIIETMEKMPGKKVTDVIIVVNRQQGGIENIQRSYPQVKVHALLNSSEILDLNNKSDNK